jgi:hypothetical protein
MQILLQAIWFAANPANAAASMFVFGAFRASDKEDGMRPKNCKAKKS